jgi:hypothetical protein
MQADTDYSFSNSEKIALRWSYLYSKEHVTPSLGFGFFILFGLSILLGLTILLTK